MLVLILLVSALFNEKVFGEEILNQSVITGILNSTIDKEKKSKELENLKRKQLENTEILVTYDVERVKKCIKTKPLDFSSINTKSAFKKTLTKCEPLSLLRLAVLNQGGDTLLIQSISNDCDLSKYKASGYICNMKQGREE